MIYNICARHKCGSTILGRILKSLKEFDQYKDNKINFSRLYSDFNFNQEDKFLFIERNPISICISMFYSFGYIHSKPERFTDEQFVKWRNNIINLGLDNYVSSKVQTQIDEVEKALQRNGERFGLLPYELMISDFESFLIKLLNFLEMPKAFDFVYSKWGDSFRPIQDRSEQIVNGDVKAHKRTTDINEWRKKLSSQEIKKYLKNPIIINYLNFVDKELNNPESLIC